MIPGEIISTDGEIDKLMATKMPYIAGFTDESIAEREDLYDVLIDGKQFIHNIPLSYTM